jgi:hypothetical protein
VQHLLRRSPHVGHRDEGGGPDGAALSVGNGEVVARRTIGVSAQLQAHVHADEPPGWMEVAPLVDAEGMSDADAHCEPRNEHLC